MTDLTWKVDTPQLVKEMVEGNPSGSALSVPAMIFLRILHDVAERAIQLDDPELNVLMLRLNLYDVPQSELLARIEEQKVRTP